MSVFDLGGCRCMYVLNVDFSRGKVASHLAESLIGSVCECVSVFVYKVRGTFHPKERYERLASIDKRFQPQL